MKERRSFPGGADVLAHKPGLTSFVNFKCRFDFMAITWKFK